MRWNLSAVTPVTGRPALNPDRQGALRAALDAVPRRYGTKATAHHRPRTTAHYSALQRTTAHLIQPGHHVQSHDMATAPHLCSSSMQRESIYRVSMGISSSSSVQLLPSKVPAPSWVRHVCVRACVCQPPTNRATAGCDSQPGEQGTTIGHGQITCWPPWAMDGQMEEWRPGMAGPDCHHYCSGCDCLPRPGRARPLTMPFDHRHATCAQTAQKDGLIAVRLEW